MLRKRMLMGWGMFPRVWSGLADGVPTWIAPAIPKQLWFSESRENTRDRRRHSLRGAFYVCSTDLFFHAFKRKMARLGYVYSNLISADRSGAAAPQSAH